MAGKNQILSNVEAQRVMAVVDEMVSEIALSFKLPSRLLESNPQIMKIFPDQYKPVVQKQAMLETQVKQISSQLREPVSEFLADKDQPERNPSEEALAQDFIHASRQLRKNTRDFCRVLKSDAGVAQKITSVLGSEDFAGSVVAGRFASVLQQLQVQTLRGLATSVEEEKAEREHFDVVAQREKKLAQEAKSLSKDLMAIKQERHKTISVKDDLIAQYKTELNELKSITAKVAATGGRKSEQNEISIRAFNERKNILLREVKKRETELEKIKLENKEKEDAVAKRSFKKETDVESWITRYDQEMADLNIEMMSTRGAYEEEKCRLRFIEDYFERWRLSEGGVALLNTSELSTQAEIDAKKNRLDVNALRIQVVVRGHLMRKELENKAKKGKKGKKGKGKGKGKKK